MTVRDGAPCAKRMKQPIDGNGETTAQSARACALAALLRMERDGAYANIVAPELARALPDQRDCRLAVSLVYGVTERRVTLDYIAGALTARSAKELVG